MEILFLSHPLDPKAVDPAFKDEFRSARSAGLRCNLLDSESFDDGEYSRAVQRVPKTNDEHMAVYRGWMLTVDQYSALYGALLKRGVRLINSPEQYSHTHHLPESYEVIRENTPRTAWTTTGSEFDLDEIMELLEPFGDRPLIIKDYVKSQKHRWDEACFIPSAADRTAVDRVTRSFIEHQDDGLIGGLVYREYIELEPLTAHSKSGMPLTEEYRIFFFDGRILCAAEYWEEGDYNSNLPSLDRFVAVASKVDSRLFSMDIAKQKDGNWIIMELGDGQVAGLPDRLDPNVFFGAIAGR